VIGEQPARLRVRLAGDRAVEVLDHEGHARERSVARRTLGGLSRALVHPVHHRIEARVHLLDGRHRRFQDFPGVDVPAPDSLGDRGRIEV
jgi:hypothetical protein